MARKTINVDYLARVEGEGGVKITFEDRKVRDVELRIFEPPRFFEAFLRGRAYTEAPDITARICGICPVAYQMSAVHAMEDAFGVTVSEPVRELRRLLYCGEWIESHVLHIYMLHAPDFLGYDGAVEMAADHGDIVRQGLELKKTGNDILELLGGRAIHPVNVRVGGFYRAPSRSPSGFSARATSPGKRCAGSAPSISPTASATTSSSRWVPRASIRSMPAAWCRTRASTSARTTTTRISRSRT
jgi:coenzyme F420-reducing hydrogenase alpha subunit